MNIPKDEMQAFIESAFFYDRGAGVLYWKRDLSKRAGYLRKDGYITVSIRNQKFDAHRLIWALEHGSFPSNYIDHINGVRSDNRLENLRDVSASINSQNIRTPGKRNKSGFLGVSNRGGKFIATLVVSGKQLYLGTFDSSSAANESYLAAKRKHHEGCTI